MLFLDKVYEPIRDEVTGEIEFDDQGRPIPDLTKPIKVNVFTGSIEIHEGAK